MRCLLACLLVASACAHAPPAPPTVVVAPVAPDLGPAPPLHLPDLSGTMHDLAKLRGRPVLLHFGASW